MADKADDTSLEPEDQLYKRLLEVARRGGLSEETAGDVLLPLLGPLLVEQPNGVDAVSFIIELVTACSSLIEEEKDRLATQVALRLPISPEGLKKLGEAYTKKAESWTTRTTLTIRLAEFRRHWEHRPDNPPDSRYTGAVAKPIFDNTRHWYTAGCKEVAKCVLVQISRTNTSNDQDVPDVLSIEDQQTVEADVAPLQPAGGPATNAELKQAATPDHKDASSKRGKRSYRVRQTIIATLGIVAFIGATLAARWLPATTNPDFEHLDEVFRSLWTAGAGVVASLTFAFYRWPSTLWTKFKLSGGLLAIATAGILAQLLIYYGDTQDSRYVHERIRQWPDPLLIKFGNSGKQVCDVDVEVLTSQQLFDPNGQCEQHNGLLTFPQAEAGDFGLNRTDYYSSGLTVNRLTEGPYTLDSDFYMETRVSADAATSLSDCKVEVYTTRYAYSKNREGESFAHAPTVRALILDVTPISGFGDRGYAAQAFMTNSLSGQHPQIVTGVYMPDSPAILPFVDHSSLLDKDSDRWVKLAIYREGSRIEFLVDDRVAGTYSLPDIPGSAGATAGATLIHAGIGDINPQTLTVQPGHCAFDYIHTYVEQ